MTGAKILVETLIEQGVDVIFGYPGGQVLDIYDALYDYQDKIRHVIASHEQGAAHAADGYARSTGKVGVVLATSGPGATNLVTGIATAYLDSVPLIAITGNVSLDLIGRDSFQEVDIAGITMPITKHNFIVKDVNQLADIVRKAFVIAKSDRPGPVLIDIPKDISGAKDVVFEPAKAAEKRSIRSVKTNELLDFCKVIEQSSKPLIYAGGGIVSSEASAELLEFSRKINAPICTSIMGISAIPYDYNLFLGMVGMHGTPVSNKAANECDLLIALGSRFSDRVALNRHNFAKKAKVVHIDIDPSEINKNVTSYSSITGDAKQILGELNKIVTQGDNSAWISELMDYRSKHSMPDYASTTYLNPREIITKISDLCDDDTIIVTDVGQHQMLTAQYYNFRKPRTLLTSGGLGTMGFGLGAAIGAKIANPDKRVVLITGDGCIHMNMNELAVCVSENLDINVVIFNNGVLGMVRQWQRLFYKSRFSSTSINRQTDYVKLAEAFGAEGLRLEDKSQIVNVLTKAFASNKTCVIDCVIHEDDSVFPIIPPGGNATDIILRDNTFN